ncbi:7-carboxy-7-deazaguanine synthase QueE [Caedibacter taeniospiralis]|uniref:7-carboxy-7-deazaguanine synthase QueE n=1 Tax=Caedibacter taeniospiralis TaxID=28907 RepID=UPI001E5A97F7|nr:7-carboxy-7-deazaguanine synthase QueE [Caedibacter taeniospiralis]
MKLTTNLPDYHKILPIIELYPCLQGEGSRRGHPCFAIRTTGCTHRCYFGESGGWCDTWYSSIHADKGKFSFSDIISMIRAHPDIREIMLTGGAPTMHPALINEIMQLAHAYQLFVTLETEGSHFVKTDYPIDLVSLSPKFSNSIPQLGITTPKNKVVDQTFIDQHNKYRLNIDAISQMIAYHKDYQFKPVCDGSEANIQEIKALISQLNIPNHKVYLMPAGSTRKEMIKAYPLIIELALQNGFNFTGRDHIIAFDDKIGV